MNEDKMNSELDKISCINGFELFYCDVKELRKKFGKEFRDE